AALASRREGAVLCRGRCAFDGGADCRGDGWADAGPGTAAGALSDAAGERREYCFWRTVEAAVCDRARRPVPDECRRRRRYRIADHRGAELGCGALCEVKFLILLSLACTCVACALRTSQRSTDMLRTQLDADWKYWMTQYPETATSVGYPGQNARWTDYTQASIDGRGDYLKKSAGRLSGIDRARLNADDQLTFDLYQDLLATAIKGLDF